ncbi:MAG TPA: PadR family transcriptional regulator [Conexibacter sp.]|jgi:DNA-binding PadR family transcriptional regulator
MERKPIRLSGTSYAVLALLSHLGESTPYDLKQALVRSIENFWQVPHTTFYAEPARLAAAGYLSERQEQHGRRRKLYALTDQGRAALDEWVASPVAAPQEVRDEAILKVFAGADPAPLLHRRREWHATKLAELEGYAQHDEWRLTDHTGPTRTLATGIAYHRFSLSAIDAYLAALEAGDQPW